jgi:hypothetical protein
MNTLINFAAKFLLFGFLFFAFTGCKKNEDLPTEREDLRTETTQKFTVRLFPGNDFTSEETMVILFEDENYVVETSMSMFLFKLENMYGLSYDSYLSVLEKIVSDAQINDLIYASTYFDNNLSNYILANILENGFCSFYDKNKQMFIYQVEVEYWRYISESLAGEGGRKFYISNELFIETDNAYIGKIETYGSLILFLENKTIEVLQMESDNNMIFYKEVILFEDDNYLIKTPLAYFISKLYYKDLSILASIIANGKTNNVLHSSSYLDEKDITRTLALFMEKGYCYCYDKMAGKVVKEITVEYWSVGVPLAATGGRRFYINNVLFLEIRDWVS